MLFQFELSPMGNKQSRKPDGEEDMDVSAENAAPAPAPSPGYYTMIKEGYGRKRYFFDVHLTYGTYGNIVV